MLNANRRIASTLKNKRRWSKIVVSKAPRILMVFRTCKNERVGKLLLLQQVSINLTCFTAKISNAVSLINEVKTSSSTQGAYSSQYPCWQ